MMGQPSSHPPLVGFSEGAKGPPTEGGYKNPPKRVFPHFKTPGLLKRGPYTKGKFPKGPIRILPPQETGRVPREFGKD